jgi:PAS domain S-box-containing protein
MSRSDPHDIINLLGGLDSDATAQLLEQFGVAAFAVDIRADGSCTYVTCNSYATTATGLVGKEISGRRPNEVVPEALAEAIVADYRTCFARRAVYSFERLSPLAPVPHWWHVTLLPILNSDGGARIIGTIIDIHEQKLAQKRLQESEHALQRAQEVGRMGHWQSNLDTGDIFWSDGLYALHRLDRATFRPTLTNVLEFYRAEDVERLTAARAQAIAERRAYSLELDIRRGDGSWMNAVVDGEPVFDSRGKLIGYFGVTRDISARVAAERARDVALRDVQALAAVMDRAQRVGRVGYFHIHYDRQFIELSPVMQSILRYPHPAPQVGMENIANNPGLMTTITEARERKSGFSFSGLMWGVDGTPLTLEIEAEAEVDANGDLIGHFGVARDVSDRARAEKQRDRALRLAEERAAVLARAQTVGRVGHFRSDHKSGRVDLSPELCAILGVPLDAPTMAWTFADSSALDAVRSEAIAEKRAFTYEGEVTAPDGNRLIMHIEAEPEFDARGALKGYFGIAKDITSRANAERERDKALQVSRTRAALLARAMDLGRMGHFRTSFDPPGLEWSPELYRLYGLDPNGPPMTRAWAETLADPADLEGYTATRMAAVAKGEGFRYRYRARHAAGHWIVLDMTVEPEWDGNGAHIGYFGIARDITEQLATEAARDQAMAEARTRLDALNRAHRLGRLAHWHYRLGSDRLDWSPELYTMHGVSPDSFTPTIDAVVATFFPNITADAFQHLLARINELKRLRYDTELQRPDGTKLHIAVQVEPEYDADGSFIGVFGTTQDITDRVRAERAQAVAEAESKAVVASLDRASVGMARLSREGVLLWVNDALAEMCGYPAADMTGQRWRALQGPGGTDLNQFIKPLSASLADGQPYECDLNWVRPDGGVRQALVRFSRVDDNSYLTMAIDRTEARRMRQLRQDMDRQLQNSQKMEALGQLAAGVAHEVNNLLQPIMTFTRHAQRDIPTEQRTRYLGIVRDSALRMRDIVAQILAFSRPMLEQPKVLEVASLIDNALAFVQPTLSPMIDISIDVAADLPPLHMVEGEFKQIIMNLLINASDALGGRGAVRIGAELADFSNGGAPAGLAAGRYVRINVADNGAGIPPDVLPRLFEPFFTTKEVGKGTGLGLSVVYGIVTRWAGAVTVTSKPGDGATFSLWLPVERDLDQPLRLTANA